MSREVLEYKQVGAVAWLTMNRPESMNCICNDMIRLFETQLPAIAADASAKVLVITGTGRGFCVGSDLKQVLAGMKVPLGEPDFLDRLCDNVFNALRRYPKPVIAALNGMTLAGGLELAMCADIVLAAETAKLGDAHANFGVYPGGGGAALLPRLVPHNVAKYLLLTGDTLSAADMKTYGFVNEVLPPDQLATRTQALAEHIASHSPIAMRRMKAVANHSMGRPLEDSLHHEQYEFRRHFRSWDNEEGLAAFVEKRKPQFQGR